jgi:hypothetical protein
MITTSRHDQTSLCSNAANASQRPVPCVSRALDIELTTAHEGSVRCNEGLHAAGTFITHTQMPVITVMNVNIQR